MSSDTASELLTRLSGVEATVDVACAAVAGFDAGQLCSTMAVVRRLQHRLDAVVGCVAERAAELAAAGEGPGVDQTLLGSGQVSARQARAEAARPATVTAFPALGAAWRSGSIGTEHLDALARAYERLDDDERAALVACDAELADSAASVPPETFTRRLWRTINDKIRHDGGQAELEQQRADSRVRWWTDRATGMGHISAALDPLRWEIVTNAINAKMRTLANRRNGEVTLDAQLAADALTELLAADPAQRQARRAGTQLTVIADARTLLDGYHPGSVHETSAGTSLSRDTIDRLACDAVIRRVTLDGRGVPIDVGRQHRTATAAQWAALQSLYRSCAWSGCDRPIGWCEAHHIVEWNDDGLTDLDNLIPLCSKHHHQAHEGGWRLRLKPDRTLHIRQPDGTEWRTTVPDRAAPADESALQTDRISRSGRAGPADDPPPERGQVEQPRRADSARTGSRSRGQTRPRPRRSRLDRESSQATSHRPETVSA